MKIVLSHWKDRESHGLKFGRNAHLLDTPHFAAVA